MPGKWARMWAQRAPEHPLELLLVPAADAEAVVRGGGADAALLRLPIDREGLHAIPLYTEATVVLAPKDHFVAAADEVSVADLVDEVVLRPLDDTLDWERPPGLEAPGRPAATEDAIKLAAGGLGVLLLPQSLFRLHYRKDLISRPVPDAPQSQVALSWQADRTTDAMELFIGIVRGRTANSTRGRPPAHAEPKRPEPARKPAPGKSTAAPRRRGAGAAQGAKRGKPRRRS